MSASNLPNNTKWQAMAAIVTQQADHITRDLPKRFRTLFFSRLIAENLLAILLQYIGLILGTLSTLPTPAWLASGTALGFVFMRGPSVLPGLWCGTFFAYYLAQGQAHVALLAATIWLAQTVLIVFFCLRWIRPTLIFYRPALLSRFFLLACVVSAGTTTLLPSAFPWVISELANLNGILLFSFPLVTLDAFFPQWDAVSRLKKSSLGIHAALLGIAILLVLMSHTPLAALISGLILSAILLRLSLRYGWCGSVAGLFATGFLLVLGSIFPAPLYQSAPLQTVNLIIIETLLLLASFLALHIGITALAKTLYEID